MRVLNISILLILTALLSSCSGGEFSVEFQLDAGLRHNYRVTYYSFRKDGGKFVEAAIPVTDGKFLLKGYSKQPTVVFLYNASDTPAMAFFVGPGEKLQISGEGVDPQNWSIKGNKIDEAWNEWSKKNKKTLAGDYKSVNKKVAEYVKNNPKDILSSVLMLTLYDRRNDEEGYAKLWNSIADSAKPAYLFQSLGRTDQYIADLDVAQPVDTLLLHTADTLLPITGDSYEFLLLHFWRSSDENREATVDSLKQLRKVYTDSLKIAIADVSFEPDSMSWRRAVKKDSVDNWNRAWAPGAEASTVAMQLKVTRTPFYLLIDKDGKQRLRTGDLVDFMKETRKTLKK